MKERLAGKRVLIVEDRFVIASELAYEVEQLGGEVVGPSRSIAEAAKLIGSEKVDIGLLDVNLDGEMVYPLAEMLSGRGVPIIFLTGYDEALLPQAWRDRPRLQKPINTRMLGEELAKLA